MNLVEAMQSFVVFAIALAIIVGVWIGVKKFILEVMKDTKFEKKFLRRIDGFLRKGK